MSKQIKDGGPAFPVPLNPGCGFAGMGPADGMTLRDYFAAKAMQGDWASQNLETNGVFSTEHSNFKSAAENYYAMADAMLRVREVKP